ncbi:uncharacterized protein BJ171DRAFT_543075 [Polychytrium aggregatum]|uniref:uncharacterized protein n=1 Tax=Polychytrium aggregatum TaxID=110093 RepID=UPI0022FDE8BF|nr:uncharacterized protein BJ171DRAFT_543075 [Polychytrium aggregatum]KAI9190638.1 hypothetical protein BJ171DRAFT_543075 [Polychytrium aggregatum]
MGQRTKARRSMIVIVIFGFCEWNVQTGDAESLWRQNPGRQHPPTRITPVGCAHPATGPANHARHCGEWGGCHTSDFHLCPDPNLHPRSMVGY